MVGCCGTAMNTMAQGLTDMSHSQQALMQNTPMGTVKWTGGFWGDRFNMLSTTGIWDMWDTWNTPYETIDALGLHGSHGFANFQVAAGTVKGKHHGPPFHDGDMYKWLEACAAVYAVTKDPKIDALMDKFIEQVALAQRADGYIHTPVVISERNAGIDSHAVKENAAGIEIGKDQKHAFASRLNFETYNLGHLITAGIIHKRATGKTTLFECGKKAADFLYNFLTNDAAELSRNAICPSHYMGAAEMYRETGDEKYLTLAKGLIAIRDSVTNGEDHNQDRHKFRDQYEAMGHAVRANYLYAGVADLYAETGERQLMKNLSAIWDDIVNHKIYIMGGCGALYDGVSPVVPYTMASVLTAPPTTNPPSSRFTRPMAASFSCLRRLPTTRYVPKLACCSSLGACSRQRAIRNTSTTSRPSYTTVFSAVSHSTEKTSSTPRPCVVPKSFLMSCAGPSIVSVTSPVSAVLLTRYAHSAKLRSTPTPSRAIRCG